MRRTSVTRLPTRTSACFGRSIRQRSFARSRLSAQVRWAVDPPLVRPARMSREDQYASEGLLHVQERNTRWTAGDMRAAWGENRDPRAVLRTGARHAVLRLDRRPPVVDRASRRCRAACERAPRRCDGSVVGTGFVSHAEGAFPIWPWPRWLFRLLAVAIVSALLAAALALGRRGD